MELVSFTVAKYRSITKTPKLPIGRSTILIGPNNEGKSNILKALVVTLEFLSRIGGMKLHRGRLRGSERHLEYYSWAMDFPISLQSKSPDGKSIFNLELKLSESEVTEFENEVKSKLNGTLPIELSLGQKEFIFKVLKRGPGGSVLSKKDEAVAKFISKRINLSYIPAVRTAKSAHEVVTELVERELATVEDSTAYQNALKAVAEIQQPILDKISTSIKETLKVFLPNVKEVQVTIPAEARFRALRHLCEISVDDGTPTQLVRKGDGVQSLAALSLMRHASESSGAGRNLILAIEEPESHLHPSAIQQLKEVITDIANKHQVIMTTHCPLFVDRTNIKSNILVHHNKAEPAKDIKEIRKILGVRASDNLLHAELLLVVEGEDDRRSLATLLKQNSSILAKALGNRALGIESLQGGSNLAYKLSQIREAICLAHSFLDYDDCGLKAAEKAEQEGLLCGADVTHAICDGMKESELEDMFDEKIYSDMLSNRYGVSILSPKFKGTAKWSDRLKAAFKHQGKIWSEAVEAKVKSAVVELVEANPSIALNAHKRSSFDALVKALEAKLNTIASSKI